MTFTHKHEVGHVNIYVAIDYNVDELSFSLSLSQFKYTQFLKGIC